MLLSAQAVTRSVVTGLPQSARSAASQQCAFDAAGSTPAGAAGHRSWLDSAFGRRGCRPVAAADLPLAEALSRRRRGDACRPQLRAAALPTRGAGRARSRDRTGAAPAPERPGDCAPAGHAGLDVGGILRRRGLGKLAALETRPPVVRYQRERLGELIHIDIKKLERIAAVGRRITGDQRDTSPGLAGSTCTCASMTPRA
jgi:hypothetical protein